MLHDMTSNSEVTLEQYPEITFATEAVLTNPNLAVTWNYALYAFLLSQGAFRWKTSCSISLLRNQEPQNLISSKTRQATLCMEFSNID